MECIATRSGEYTAELLQFFGLSSAQILNVVETTSTLGPLNRALDEATIAIDEKNDKNPQLKTFVESARPVVAAITELVRVRRLM